MAKAIGKIASKYARALLQNVQAEFGNSVKESGKTPAQELAEKLEGFALSFDTDKALHNALLSPMFPEEQRLGALQAVAKTLDFSDSARNFLKIVFQRGRLPLVGQIAAAFSQLADQAASVVKVEVVTARAIDTDERNDIASQLTGIIPGKLQFQWSVDPELIGGVLVRYGGSVLDGTLKSRLSLVERTLLQ